MDLKKVVVLVLVLEDIDGRLGHTFHVRCLLLPATVSVNDEDHVALLDCCAEELAEVALLELRLGHFLENTPKVVVMHILLGVYHAG